MKKHTLFQVVNHSYLVPPDLEATQGQMDGFFRQLLYKCYLEEVASVGDWLKRCPPLDSRVANVTTARGSSRRRRRPRLSDLQRYLAHKKTPTPLGPPWDPRHWGESAAADAAAADPCLRPAELVPALGALFPGGGPVQDPVLTPCRTAVDRVWHM